MKSWRWLADPPAKREIDAHFVSRVVRFEKTPPRGRSTQSGRLTQCGARWQAVRYRSRRIPQRSLVDQFEIDKGETEAVLAIIKLNPSDTFRPPTANRKDDTLSVL